MAAVRPASPCSEERSADHGALLPRRDTWLGWGETREADRPPEELRPHLPTGAARVFGDNTRFDEDEEEESAEAKAHHEHRPSAPVGPVCWNAQSHGTDPGNSSVSRCGRERLAYDRRAVCRPTLWRRAPSTTSLHSPISGVPDTIVLRGVTMRITPFFTSSIPQTQVVKTATMKLHSSLLARPDPRHLVISQGELESGLYSPRSPSIRLLFHRAHRQRCAGGESVAQCHREQCSAGSDAHASRGDALSTTMSSPSSSSDTSTRWSAKTPSHTTLWSHVDPTTTIQLAGSLLPLHNDLKLLPLPFYDAAVNLHPVVPIVFLSQPSPKALQAAGIVTSWFGILTDFRPARFPVSIGTIPTGNAIRSLVKTGPTFPRPSKFNESLRPDDRHAGQPKRSILQSSLSSPARNPEELMTAAMRSQYRCSAICLKNGDQVRISSLKVPEARKPDDAPRWLVYEHHHSRRRYYSNRQPAGRWIGSSRGLYARSSRPLLWGDAEPRLSHGATGTTVHLISNESSLQVYMNDSYVKPRRRCRIP